jgi:hypothetical protein
MEISNKFIVIKSWGNMFVIRFPSKTTRPFFMFWIEKQPKPMHSLLPVRIWKIKISLELG